MTTTLARVSTVIAVVRISIRFSRRSESAAQLVEVEGGVAGLAGLAGRVIALAQLLILGLPQLLELRNELTPRWLGQVRNRMDLRR
jgi:hypothetical protein